MRYAPTASWIPKQIHTKWFVGSTPHDFEYRLLHTGAGVKVQYGGYRFSCKQDAKRNLSRMLIGYQDHELISGENGRILLELAQNAYPGRVPDTTRFAKVEEPQAVYFLDQNTQLFGVCYMADLISAL